MNWRWLIYDHIPADLNVPKVQRRAIRKEVRNTPDIMRSVHGVIAFIIGMVIFMLLFYALIDTMEYLDSRYPSFGFPYFNILLIPALLQCFSAGVHRSFYLKKTYQVLHQFGYQICPECGYLLKGLPEDRDRCPECGTPREPLPETKNDEQT